MAQSPFEIKKEICDIGKRIYDHGFVAANDGNISVKVGPNEYYCTPTGVSKGFMTHDMIIKLDACNRESGSNGGMSVNDSVNVGTLLEDAHVHLDLGGGIELTVDLVALAVYLDDHVGCHITLRYTCRCAVELVGSYLNGDVTVIGSYEAVVVDSFTNFAYFFFDLKG